jgi:hypothetical protein
MKVKVNKAYLHTVIIGVGATIIVAAQDSLTTWSHSLTSTAHAPKAVIIGSLLAGLSRFAGFAVNLLSDPTPDTQSPPPNASNK